MAAAQGLWVQQGPWFKFSRVSDCADAGKPVPPPAPSDQRGFAGSSLWHEVLTSLDYRWLGGCAPDEYTVTGFLVLDSGVHVRMTSYVPGYTRTYS